MYVILNEVKNLKVSETVDGSANLEMLRFRSAYSVNEIATACSKPRNDAHNNVILNVVKNLLNDNTLSTLLLVGFEEIATSGIALLAMTIILSTLSLGGRE